MLATAWGLGITYPQSIKRVGHFLTADNISAGTPNGGRAYPALRKMRMLSLFSVKEKVAQYLIKMATEQQSRTIHLDVSRQEMADIFGIQKFSLLRCLSEFEEKGAIRIEGKTITILNSDEMK